MPSHTHTWSGGLSDVMGNATSSSSTAFATVAGGQQRWSGGGSVSGTNANTGGGQAHENRPAFYEVAYIIKT